MAPLEHMLALLECVPIMPGLTQRGGKPLTSLEPVRIIPASDCFKRTDNLAGYVQRFLIEAQATQIPGYCTTGVKGEQVVGAQDPAAVVKRSLVGFQGL